MKNLLILALASISLYGCSDSDMGAACSADDLDCRARAFMVKADVLCKERIEKLAKSDLKWDQARDRPLLSNYEWKDKAKGTITYSGDKAQIQAPTGEYVTEKYECDIDPGNKTAPLLDVRVMPEKS
jgi:hypothetical protein